MIRIDSQKFAVMSDIHGNIDALRAVILDIEMHGIRNIVSLGDHLSGPLAAEETADFLMSQASIINIRGNHDRQLVQAGFQNMSTSDRVAYAQLSKVHLDWLNTLPSSLIINDDIFLCHGTPSSDTEYWLEQVNSEGLTMSQFSTNEVFLSFV